MTPLIKKLVKQIEEMKDDILAETLDKNHPSIISADKLLKEVKEGETQC